jgi:hypothetical protein
VNLEGLLEPFHGPVVVAGDKIVLGDARCSQAPRGHHTAGPLEPCRHDVREESVGALKAGFGEALLERFLSGLVVSTGLTSLNDYTTGLHRWIVLTW